MYKCIIYVKLHNPKFGHTLSKSCAIVVDKASNLKREWNMIPNKMMFHMQIYLEGAELVV